METKFSAAHLRAPNNTSRQIFLQAGGKDQNMLTMTFSEFGRRVNENGSLGTDHGAAAPLIIFGLAVNGNGFIGDDVNFSDLDQ
ncbi:MAG: DUF1501 domain-containing protein [Bacteroidia bacterium]